MFLRTLGAALAIVTLGDAVTPSARGFGPAATRQASIPLRQSGPLRKVPSGPHPSFPWPPKGPGVASQACKPIQYNFPASTNSDPTRANAVRDFYNRSWSEYTKYCFGEDDLNPLSNTCDQDLFGWGASIVDGIDTAIVMNLEDIVKAQLAQIAKVDFS